MIFCDMDGVLVDFDKEFERNHGVLPYLMHVKNCGRLCWTQKTIG